ncbi:unnamed protein product [Cladocopium goreaui]|uniref:Copia protein n=1 Tax=Cladocopium goreaui TaxID=2562237 RepID=A0A9P1DTB4_9DINO|nr:unnamed protein product [Cladocopium goreaui]
MKGKRAAPSTKTPDAKATPALVREYDDDFIVNAVPIEKKNKMDVKFNDKVETIVYVKPDFVECPNRKPKRNMSRAQKKSLTCRTTKEIIDDQQWVLQSKLGMTRARAIGILMDDYSEFSDVDEVHIILGPKNDIKLKINNIDFLENNSRAEICYEEDYRPSSDYEAELVMKVLGLNGNNHASRTIYLDGESGDEMSESDDGVGTYVDGPTKSLKKTKKKKRSKRKTTPVEMDIKLDKEKADDVEVVDGPPLPPPDGEPPHDGPEHHSMGKPGDGIIYLSDIGEHVKLDKRGRPYRVGPDGRKEVRGSPRPKSSYSPEEWRALSAKERDVIIRRGKLEEEAEKLKEIKLKKEKEKKAKAEISEKKKHDSSSSKDPAKDESRKKKKKDNKKSKESSGKDGGKDTILITDLNYKCQANSGGTTNIQYGLDEMGYVVTVIDINSFKSVTRAQKFLDAVEHLIKSVMPNITAEENVTIHFWISFAFLITDTHPYHVWVERNYAERLAEAIRRVDKLATRPIVSLCKDPRFHGIRTGIQ